VITSGLTYTKAAGRTDTPSSVHVRTVRTGWGSSRLVHWVAFWLWAMLIVPFGRWDRCILMTDPPFMLPVAALCRLLGRRSRSIFWWTMDLYPEAMIANGMISSQGLAAKLLRAINNVGLKHVSGVVALGPAQRGLLARNSAFDTSPAFCTVVPPWDFRSLPRVGSAENRFLEKFGWHERRIALYAGNLGEAHSFKNLLAAAQWLADRGDVRWLFVFVVRGSKSPALKHAAASIDNVVVLDYQPPELTADLLFAATVHVITMKRGWEGIVVPSKLYGIAATDKPVLFIGPRNADTAIEIEKYGLGACVVPDAGPAELVAQIEWLASRSLVRAKALPTDGPQKIANFITESDKGSQQRALNSEDHPLRCKH
jgi:colanic acid biosynthesis glycosyl transferase WcaI